MDTSDTCRAEVPRGRDTGCRWAWPLRQQAESPIPSCAVPAPLSVPSESLHPLEIRIGSLRLRAGLASSRSQNRPRPLLGDPLLGGDLALHGLETRMLLLACHGTSLGVWLVGLLHESF